VTALTEQGSAEQTDPTLGDGRSGVDRRAVLRGACVACVGVGAAAVLAACGGSGGGDASGDSGDSGSSADSGGSGGSNGTYQATDVPVGGGKVYDADKVVITQPSAGEYKAFSAVCTHQGFLVGNVQGGTINCFHHGSKYNDATGAVEAGPAPAPLPTKTVTVNGSTITVT
jgi:Rieske Fe-S protein